MTTTTNDEAAPGATGRLREVKQKSGTQSIPRRAKPRKQITRRAGAAEFAFLLAARAGDQ